ncbi:hypothetical protein ACGVWS_14715 [Enterobacteriaceae bacterium LUAb1]
MGVIINNLEGLDSPELPQEVDGAIDVASIIDNQKDLIVDIEPYENEHARDEINVYVGSIKSTTHYVTVDEVDTGASFRIYIPFANIPSDDYVVTYTAISDTGNKSTSTGTPLKIINSPSLKFQAPTYPDAKSGVIGYQALNRYGGLRFHIHYVGMKASDQLVFHWSGNTYSNNPVTAATWQSATITVSDADVKNGYVLGTVPKEHVLCLNENGHGNGYYTKGSTGSAPGSVLLSLDDISPPQLLICSGAPPISPSYPKIQPKNLVVVYGPPGKDLLANIDAGEFSANGEKEYAFKPDDSGMAQFYVQSHDFGAIHVGVIAEDGSDQASGIMNFSNWTDGDDVIASYAISNNAPADGINSCTIYVRVDSSFYNGDSITVTTDKNSVIDGFYEDEAQNADVSLRSDGTTEIRILNTQAEHNQVTLSYPGAADSLKLHVNFEKFPY